MVSWQSSPRGNDADPPLQNILLVWQHASVYPFKTTAACGPNYVQAFAKSVPGSFENHGITITKDPIDINGEAALTLDFRNNPPREAREFSAWLLQRSFPLQDQVKILLGPATTEWWLALLILEKVCLSRTRRRNIR